MEETQHKLRVMVDANVLVAGAVWPRFPFEVLRHATVHDYQLALSQKIIQEARETVLEIAPAQISHLEAILKDAAYEAIADPHEDEIQANFDLIRDPKDVHVALAAINSKVDFLITQDRDFTDRDESTEKLHQHLNIVLPGTFLREHMGWSSDGLESIRKRNWDDPDFG